MDIFFQSLFAGIHLAIAILSFFIYRKNNTQDLYFSFGMFSFFSGIYFTLISLSRTVDWDLYKEIIVSSIVFYGIFPWFVYEFIEREMDNKLWFLSSIFGLAMFLFVFEIGNGKFDLWQLVAHVGLLGSMTLAVFASYKLKIRKQQGAREFIVLTIFFLFLGLEEIVSSYSNIELLGIYSKGFIPLDFYPILFTLTIGSRLSNDFYFKTKMDFERLKNSDHEKVFVLKELEKQRLEVELRYKKRDLTDFGIEITKRKEYIENILAKLKIFKNMDNIQPSDINKVIQYAKSQQFIGNNFKI